MPAYFLLIAFLGAAHLEASEACEKTLDVTFLVDSSICNGVETCPQWNSVIQFSKNIVNSLTIGPDDSRVAFITVSSDVKKEWNFNGYTDKNALLSAIGRVAYKGGELSNLLSAGIFFTDIFTPDSGDRPYVSTVIIGITDGFRLIDTGKGAGVSIALQKIGIKVFLVCLPGCTESLAKSFASDPKQANVTYFLLDNYFALDAIAENLVKQFCAI